MGEHSPTPWEYRPDRYDDWGWIRGPKMDRRIAPLVAIARSGEWESEAVLDEHRKNKTDPCEANAAYIVKCVNAHAGLVKALEEAIELLESYSFSRGIDPKNATPESVIGQARAALASLSEGK